MRRLKASSDMSGTASTDKAALAGGSALSAGYASNNEGNHGGASAWEASAAWASSDEWLWLAASRSIIETAVISSSI